MIDNSTEITAKLRVMTFRLRAHILLTLLRKANFNPDQPRVPAGSGGGGQWTDGFVMQVQDRPADYVDLRKEKENEAPIRSDSMSERRIANWLQEWDRPPGGGSWCISEYVETAHSFA